VCAHQRIHSELAAAHIEAMSSRCIISVNATRFYILATAGFLVPPPLLGGPRCALVRTAWQPANTSASEWDVKSSVNIAKLLVTLGLPCTRVDRRPSLARIPFHDVYFVEVQQDDPTDETQDWEAQVQQALRRLKDINGDVSLLGIW